MVSILKLKDLITNGMFSLKDFFFEKITKIHYFNLFNFIYSLLVYLITKIPFFSQMILIIFYTLKYLKGNLYLSKVNQIYLSQKITFPNYLLPGFPPTPSTPRKKPSPKFYSQDF
uniref:Uncharacterized protein n=1 Tax=Solanum lycopersicum TaxID=4081 RepID=A0A3Q7F2T6_SOLLC